MGTGVIFYQDNGVYVEYEVTGHGGYTGVSFDYIHASTGKIKFSDATGLAKTDLENIKSLDADSITVATTLTVRGTDVVLTNDSRFGDISDNATAIAGKQDRITSLEPLSYTLLKDVPPELSNNLQDLHKITANETAILGKQDKIGTSNKLSWDFLTDIPDKIENNMEHFGQIATNESDIGGLKAITGDNFSVGGVFKNDIEKLAGINTLRESDVTGDSADTQEINLKSALSILQSKTAEAKTAATSAQTTANNNHGRITTNEADLVKLKDLTNSSDTLKTAKLDADVTANALNKVANLDQLKNSHIGITTNPDDSITDLSTALMNIHSQTNKFSTSDNSKVDPKFISAKDSLNNEVILDEKELGQLKGLDASNTLADKLSVKADKTELEAISTGSGATRKVNADRIAAKNNLGVAVALTEKKLGALADLNTNETVQAQLDAKQPTIGSNAKVNPEHIDTGDATITIGKDEFKNLNNLTENVQDKFATFDSKFATVDGIIQTLQQNTGIADSIKTNLVETRNANDEGIDFSIKMTKNM